MFQSNMVVKFGSQHHALVTHHSQYPTTHSTVHCIPHISSVERVICLENVLTMEFFLALTSVYISGSVCYC